VSIGVIHHIPDPRPTIVSAKQALKPGGKLIVWLYGKEGNDLYLALFKPLRAMTKRLPDVVLEALCWLLWIPLWCYVRFCAFLPLPMRAYARGHLAKLSTRQLVATIFDQLNPAYAKYYSRDEAIALLEDAGFTDIRLDHRHGYSWTVCGTRV
jgi:SAM-dependent methyltransferase